MKNFRVLLSGLLALIIVASLSLVGCSSPKATNPATSAPTTPAAQVIKWRGQSSFISPANPYGPYTVDEIGVPILSRTFTKWLNAASGGRVSIDWSEPAALFPVADTDTNIGNGVADIALSYGGYYSSRMPEGDIETGGIFYWDDEAQAYEAMYKYGLFEILQQAYAEKNMVYLPAHCDAILGVAASFDLSTPDAIKGKKFRAVGAQGDFIQALGGSAVALPPAEIYMALKLGTVEGTCMGSGDLEAMKLKEVLKSFVIKPRINSAFCNLLINMDSFKGLPQDIQTMIQRDSRYVMYAASVLWHNQNVWALKNAEKEYGLKLVTWSTADQNKVNKIVVEQIYPKFAGKNARCKQMMDIIINQMKAYGRI